MKYRRKLMPKCNISEAHVIDYVYGGLNQSQSSDFEQHLTTCNKCTKKVYSYNRVLHLVDDAEHEFIPVALAPRNLEVKLYKRLADAPPEKTSPLSCISNYFANLLFVLHERKVASICIFSIAAIAVAFFVSNPFRPTTLDINRINSADARIEQYRHQDIQRSLEDVLRKKHLRHSDSWDTVSQLNRVKDRAQGTDWANIANNQLKSVHSEF